MKNTIRRVFFQESYNDYQKSKILSACKQDTLRLQINDACISRFWGYDNNAGFLHIVKQTKHWFIYVMFWLAYNARIAYRTFIVRDIGEVVPSTTSAKRVKATKIYFTSDKGFIKTIVGMIQSDKDSILVTTKSCTQNSVLDLANITIVYIEDILQAYHNNMPKMVWNKYLVAYMRYSSLHLPYATMCQKQFTDFIKRTEATKLIIGKIRRITDTSFALSAKANNMHITSIIPVASSDSIESHWDLGNLVVPNKILVHSNDHKNIIKKYTDMPIDVVNRIHPRTKAVQSYNNYILVIGQTLPAWSLSEMMDCVETIKKCGYVPIVKLHPKTKLKDFEKLPCTILDEKSSSTDDLVKNAVCIITGHSSVAEEAHEIGIPAVTYHNKKLPSEHAKLVLKRYHKLGIQDFNSKKELSTFICSL